MDLSRLDEAIREVRRGADAQEALIVQAVALTEVLAGIAESMAFLAEFLRDQQKVE